MDGRQRVHSYYSWLLTNLYYYVFILIEIEVMGVVLERAAAMTDFLCCLKASNVVYIGRKK